MPRIRPRELFAARAIDRHLGALLPVCRHLGAARNELRWMKEHALGVSQRLGHIRPAALLRSLVHRRAHGEPLQYVLGSEYFGDLEIQCRPGVLIPRQETAASVAYLAHLVSRNRAPAHGAVRRLRFLDLCTGSGCAALLFHHRYYQQRVTRHDTLELVGLDVSHAALSLARENLLRQIAHQEHDQRDDTAQRTRSLTSIGFVQADVLKARDVSTDSEHRDSPDAPLPVLPALRRLSHGGPPDFDILVSNPPYISPRAFISTTARSVRRYEPRLALVPPASATASDTEVGDLFYPHLLRIADDVKAKVVLVEVADLEQAKRVAAMTVERGWSTVEIWRDEPSAVRSAQETAEIKGRTIDVRGTGNGRSVFACRNEALSWLVPHRADT